MTRIINTILAATMAGGLMFASLGGAQADPVAQGNENGGSFEWTLPTVGLPKLEVTINGEKHTVGGDDALGGKLAVSFRASDWQVSNSVANCPAGQAGSNIALTGKTPNAAMSAIYTPLTGPPTNLGGQPVENKYPTAHFGLCV